ncbi:MAG: DUF4079 family protein [bacterium]|nr:DUF4079 family protein [bacterium]
MTADATLVSWLHPLVGLVTVLLALRLASLGLAMQRGGRRAGAARRAHARFGPWLVALVVLSWLGGWLTVWLVRDDLHPAASMHFRLGTLMLAAVVAAAVVSRSMATADWARRVHPWLGAVVVLLAGLQVFIGWQLMRW